MALNLREPEDHELRARITVFGVGGAGGNAVNNMIDKQLPGVEFIVANTDAQALGHTKAPRKVQLGTGVTRGLGAGSKPEVGYSAAEETIDEIATALEGCHMCFITAGMGGGTGTGAAPVVSRVAREMGILTVGVVTKPFHFEGSRRMQIAEEGVAEMQQVVDTLIVIPNQNLFQVASERTTFVEAFVMADDVLYQGVQGVTDLMIRPGMINLDFADVKSVMEEMGKAMMGTGEADGETRAIDAAEKAIANPLLDEVSLKGARGVLINITGGYDLTLFEMDEAANRIKEEVDAEALIKFGSAIDPEMEGKMRVSVVATGIDAEPAQAAETEAEPEMPARRRPPETDPTMVAAVRGRAPAGRAAPGTERAAPAARGAGAAEPAQPAETQGRQKPGAGASGGHGTVLGGRSAILRGRGARQEAPESRAAPEPAREEPAPAPQPERAEEPAEAPAPSDMRARAELVRRRALEARRGATDTGGRQAGGLDDDASGLFDFDSAAIDPGSIDAPDPGPERAPAPQARPAREEPAREQPRQGLFTINKLIHRVAGTGGEESRGEPQRTEPRSRHDVDDEESDIPAFLRRQAN
jgi:cell division protein FtsZ